MRVSVERHRPTEVQADALVINLFEGEKPTDGPLADLDRATGGAITRAIDLGEIRGKLHETTLLTPSGGLAAPRLLVVGSAAEREFSTDRARTVAGAALRALLKRDVKRAALFLRSGLDAAEQAQAAVEGALLATFDPGQYKTVRENERHEVEEISIVEPEAERALAAEPAARRGAVIAEAQNYARGLSNAPGNKLYPIDLADEARKLADLGMEVEVLERPQLEALGMGGILAVGGGSEHPPALALVRYRGAGDAPFLGLVGKGVTFDSGGISIKPSEKMHQMRMDMSGAAAVLGAMRAIGHLKPKSNVLGVIAAVENLPSGRAYRPGDVITALSGKTIEVLSTDAEGRIILADAVAYAQRRGAKRLVDAATLTGAVVVALGHVATGVMGTPQDWVDRVMSAGRVAGERMWQLPLFDEYRDQIRSDLADVSNTGGRPAGTITGALFIKEFVEDGVPWVHLDIAGTAWTEKETPFLAKGPTGVGVRTFVNLALEQTR